MIGRKSRPNATSDDRGHSLDHGHDGLPSAHASLTCHVERAGNKWRYRTGWCASAVVPKSSAVYILTHMWLDLLQLQVLHKRSGRFGLGRPIPTGALALF